MNRLTPTSQQSCNRVENTQKIKISNNSTEDRIEEYVYYMARWPCIVKLITSVYINSFAFILMSIQNYAKYNRTLQQKRNPNAWVNKALHFKAYIRIACIEIFFT